jgi:hypothetical protein
MFRQLQYTIYRHYKTFTPQTIVSSAMNVQLFAFGSETFCGSIKYRSSPPPINFTAVATDSCGVLNAKTHFIYYLFCFLCAKV